MRVQNSLSHQLLKPSFKSTSYYDDSDYASYYNDFSIKDALISTTILSGALIGIGAIIQNEQNISKFFQTAKNKIRTFFVPKNTQNKLNKLV